MSRHGYSDEFGDDDPLAHGRYRGQVASAIRGTRGQAFLRKMRDALDAMPEKRLIAGELVSEEGECCALGAVALAAGIDVTDIDPEDAERVAACFGIAEVLAREISYENDEYGDSDDDEKRWRRMRNWVEWNSTPEAAGAEQ